MMKIFQYPANLATSEPKIHEQALQLRARRFDLLASNIANADTPNYKARDIDFNAELERAMGPKHRFVGLTTTTGGHLPSSMKTLDEELLYKVPAQSSLDGNTVDMDQERVAFAENALRMQFSLEKSLGAYKSKLDMYTNMTS